MRRQVLFFNYNLTCRKQLIQYLTDAELKTYEIIFPFFVDIEGKMFSSSRRAAASIRMLSASSVVVNDNCRLISLEIGIAPINAFYLAYVLNRVIEPCTFVHMIDSCAFKWNVPIWFYRQSSISALIISNICVIKK